MLRGKKIISVLLILIMVLAISGCGEKKQTDNQISKESSSSTDNNQSKDNNDEIEANSMLVSDKAITFKVFEYSDKPFKDDYPVIKKIKELTNVSLKGVLNDSITDQKQAYNMMISSGDIVDIIFFYRNELFRDGVEGAYIPLQDLIKEHAPNIQAILDQYPEAKKTATGPDGNMYYVPNFNDGQAATGYYIRQDWLDNLGLEIPKTVDEFYNVLKAFKEQDANGNGDPNDEVPYFCRDNQAVLTHLLYMWDAKNEYYVDNGEIKHGHIEPEFKVAMTELAKWYKEGLIDAELFTRGGKARDIMLNDNIGGSTHDWFGSTASYNDKLKSSIDGFNWVPFLPPASTSGKVIESRSRGTGNNRGAAISSKCKDPISAIKFLDFCYSEEGRRLLNFGIEGEDYTMVDGIPVFKDEVLSEDNVLVALRKRGIQINLAYQQDFNYEKQWINPIAKQGMEMYINADCFFPSFPYMNYTTEEQDRLNELNAPIKTYVAEVVQKWILGVEDIDATFDKYLETLENMGIKEVLDIQNNAYKRYLNQN
ncbi:extracellular solute-binding protein [Vallitalea sp.]|uniref:extracellular solute-binding protein n=1 Tax=Vallitalea sp. TaxID=1882829 RepID=UPI0025EB3713|nr:extracellular solute-binding protein [Vallitalea sp.]MCT4685798.1 extracellular solute-binding protein [Vallitalea sp.]